MTGISVTNIQALCYQDNTEIITVAEGENILLYITEGSADITVNGAENSLTAGTYCIWAGEDILTEKYSAGASVIRINFSDDLHISKPGIFADTEGNVINSISSILEEWKHDYPYKQMMLCCILQQLLIQLKRTHGRSAESEELLSIIQYINENLDKDIDFQALAKQQNYSYHRFRHVFKNKVGVSPHQYIINARIERAKFLLKTKANISLTEISLSCGFSSSSHFTKTFHTHVGSTPSQYSKEQAYASRKEQQYEQQKYY